MSHVMRETPQQNDNNIPDNVEAELRFQLYTFICSSLAWLVFFFLLLFSPFSIWFSVSSLISLMCYDLWKGIISAWKVFRKLFFAESEDFKNALESIFMLLYKVNTQLHSIDWSNNENYCNIR